MFVRLFLIAMLAVGLACAKTYNFTLPNTSQAGSTTLKPGDYKLKVDGAKVVLKDADGHDVTANTKIETSDKPYTTTEVSMTQSNGTSKIEWIGLGGSKSKIVFE
jgi:hypothetical protein